MNRCFRGFCAKINWVSEEEIGLVEVEEVKIFNMYVFCDSPGAIS